MSTSTNSIADFESSNHPEVEMAFIACGDEAKFPRVACVVTTYGDAGYDTIKGRLVIYFYAGGLMKD